MNDAELGYAAGIFDGEGTVTIRKTANRGGYFSLVALVYSTDRAVLDWLKARWGGSVYAHPHKLQRKVVYELQLQQNAAKQFLADVYPYLIIKKERARIGRAFGALTVGDAVKRSWNRYEKAPQGWRDAQQKLKNKLKQLNQRGLSSAHDGAPVELAGAPGTGA